VLRGIEFETALAKMIDISFVAMTAKAGAAPLHVLQRLSVTRGGNGIVRRDTQRGVRQDGER
jgi:hypothetical protein